LILGKLGSERVNRPHTRKDKHLKRCKGGQPYGRGHNFMLLTRKHFTKNQQRTYTDECGETFAGGAIELLSQMID